MLTLGCKKKNLGKGRHTCLNKQKLGIFVNAKVEIMNDLTKYCLKFCDSCYPVWLNMVDENELWQVRKADTLPIRLIRIHALIATFCIQFPFKKKDFLGCKCEWSWSINCNNPCWMLWIYLNFLKLRFSEQNHIWELNVTEVLISSRARPLPLRYLSTIRSQSLDPLHITPIHQSEVREQTEAPSLSFTST